MARSGLKKAALMARSMSLLGKPMASICVIASCPWLPIRRAEGSLKVALEAAAPAGEGVAGVSEEVTFARVGAEGVARTGADGGAAGV